MGWRMAEALIFFVLRSFVLERDWYVVPSYTSTPYTPSMQQLSPQHLKTSVPKSVSVGAVIVEVLLSSDTLTPKNSRFLLR
jgi:hypothetical protein